MRKSINLGETEHEKRWIYLLLSFIIMICLGTVYSWSVFRVLIEELFHVGSTQSGLPYMVSLAVYSLFMFLTGKHLDKYSPRLIITIGAALVGLGWILSSYAPNIYILTITYGVIIGAGVGIAYGAPMNVIARLFPEKKGVAVGLVLSGFGLSPLVTAPFARYLMANIGIMKTFLLFGVFFGITIPLLAYPLRHFHYTDNNKLLTLNSIERRKNDIATFEMLKSKDFKELYFNFIIGTMIGLMIIGITNNIGIELIKMPPKTVTLFISLFAVFNSIGRPVFGWITDQWSSKKAMLVSYVLIITAAVLMILAKEGSLFLYSIAFSIFWFNLGGWLAIAPTSTLAMYGTKYYSQNFGVVFTAYGIGAILGVTASGLLMDLYGNYQIIFYLVICLCCLGIISSQKLIKYSAN